MCRMNRMKATLSTLIVLVRCCVKDWRDYMLSIDNPFRFNVHPALCTPISYIQSSDLEHEPIALHAPIIISIVMSEYKCCSSVSSLKMLLTCVLQINQLKLNKPVKIELNWNMSSMSRQLVKYNRMTWFKWPLLFFTRESAHFHCSVQFQFNCMSFLWYLI